MSILTNRWRQSSVSHPNFWNRCSEGNFRLKMITSNLLLLRTVPSGHLLKQEAHLVCSGPHGPPGQHPCPPGLGRWPLPTCLPFPWERGGQKSLSSEDPPTRRVDTSL